MLILNKAMPGRPGTSGRIICSVGLFLMLAGCQQSTSLKVDSEIPAPLLTQLPVSMGVLYNEQLRNYVYEENSDERPNWKINSGESHVALFNQVLPSMFQEVREVAGIPTDTAVDAVLLPNVEEMQFALPGETRTDFYEAWIKYDMKLYNKAGDQIASWPVTGYGKSSTQFMKSRDKGLNAAVNQALRDAGAKFALGFPKINGVDAWLAEKNERGS